MEKRRSYEEYIKYSLDNIDNDNDPNLKQEQREIGLDCFIVIRYRDNEPWGCAFVHRMPDGKACEGWIPFAPHSPDGWQLESLSPLTISPSVLCRGKTCGDFHGWIKEDKWISV